MKPVLFSADALKTLKRQPRPLAQRLRDKVVAFATDPVSQANNVKALRGRPGVVRLRVGDWRVILEDRGDVFVVVRIAPRGSVYD